VGGGGDSERRPIVKEKGGVRVGRGGVLACLKEGLTLVDCDDLVDGSLHQEETAPGACRDQKAEKNEREAGEAHRVMMNLAVGRRGSMTGTVARDRRQQ